MTKQKSKRILKIIFIMASISSLFFVPWILLRLLLTPLPETVQEQVNDAIGYGLDGMIASFSRALTEGISAQQSDDEFDKALDEAIESIYQASRT